MAQEFDEQGWKLVQKTVQQKRFHDVTILIEGRDGRFALMSKHSYPPGVFRSPSGGVNPGEDIADGALREAREETGLAIELKRFILHITLDITYQGDVITWDSYIFHATTPDLELNPTDLKEVKSAIWANRAQMLDMAGKLRNTDVGGLIYRGNLTEASLWALDHPMVLEEARPSDTAFVEDSIARHKLNGVPIGDALWFVARIDGLQAGTVGLAPHDDCVELTGLTIEHTYQGRGVGQALVEFVTQQWKDPAKRRKLAELKDLLPAEPLWLVTHQPGYFFPVDFEVAERGRIPLSLRGKLQGTHSRDTAMHYRMKK